MKIQIFSTGYEWNVIASLNKFIDGVLFGLGLLLVALIFSLYLSITDKKKEVPNDATNSRASAADCARK